ncbi:ABC transporter permease [Spirochaeta thermophila]|uniref:Transporter n=1 Tax=Winmispira thermophila (strain ATCC 49972 / DSM 6192 / RI 19.B1) TaxID=665571 RepID=E0RPP6_WINT6|nr:ABC transporter permease subunit [Spirochaeta thermophila]ADN01360.1 transporter [Spirochaeta thermophila DSM 6192]
MIEIRSVGEEAGSITPSGSPSRGSASFLTTLKKNRQFLVMLIPVTVYLLVFNYAPMAGLILAFKRYIPALGFWKSPWAGLSNFKFLFVSGAFGRILFNTVFYNVIFLVTCQALGMMVAILISELRLRKLNNLLHSLTFFPYFVSYVVVGAIVYNIFSYEFGVFNNLLEAWGAEPVNVYQMPNVWVFILTFLNSWKWVGYTSIIYYTTIVGIDPELYEAAEIDGASTLARIWHITVPYLKVTLLTIVLFQLGSIFKGQFDLFYNVIGNNGQLFEATDVVDTYVFRMLITNFDVGLGTAAGLFQSFFGFLLMMIVNGVVKKVRPQYALF